MQPGAIVAQRFELERVAGRGGMGVVYRARDRVTGELVALKVLTIDGERDAQRFAREQHLLAELAHPGIVRYVAHGLAPDGRPFLAMEWLEGEDLAERLARGGLTMREGVALATRVAQALGAAHARGIIHRDVKPSNLFLPAGAVEDVKLLDFGIARKALGPAALTGTGLAIGTPGYMAPEQARGSRSIDARADVFSLGCVLFECLAGAPPFTGAHVLAVLAKILLEEAPLLCAARSDVPAELGALVARTLAKDPALRPADGDALALELEAIGPTKDARRAPSLPPKALTGDERRLFCLVFMGRAEGAEALGRAATMSGADATLGSSAAASLAAPPDVQAVVAPFGAELTPLLGGGCLAVLTGAGAATDLAAQAARCALAVAERCPGRAVALSTGRAEIAERTPVGALIDRAAALLGGPAPTGAGARRGIRVDEITAGLLDGRFEVAGDGAGLFLCAERALGDATRTLLGKATPCVGRERQIDTLLDTLDQAVEGLCARVTLVTAPAGAGKSRVRYEVLRRLKERGGGVEVWLGQGDPMRAGSPFGMLAAPMRRAAGVREGEPTPVRRQKLRARVARNVAPADVERVAAFLGELSGTPFDDAASVELRSARKDAMVMGDQIRRAFEDFLAAECAAGPVLLVLEDLQWGDLSSVRLVDAALRALADRPLMVLALARPEVHELFPSLWAGRGVEELRLAALTRKASERLIREVLGEGATPAMVARLVERAEGNAFYLEELLRAVATGRGDELPETVLAMVQARLEALAPEARMILRAASVFGQAFWLRGVMALLGGAARTARLAAELDALGELELVARRPEAKFRGEEEYVFRNALVREAAYASLTDADRELGHRLAGAWLEAAGESDAMALVEHFERGGVPARAVRWYRRGAEQALEGDDIAQAVARAERGIACVVAMHSAAGATLASPGALPSGGALAQATPVLGNDESFLRRGTPAADAIGALRLIQAEAHRWRGDNAEAARAGLEATRLLELQDPQWPRAAGEAAVSTSRLGQSGELLGIARELEARAASGDARPELAIAAARVAVSLAVLGLDARAAEIVSVAVSVVRAGPAGADPAALGWLARAQAILALHSGDAGGYLVLMEAATVHAERAGDLRTASGYRVNVGFANVELGRYELAEPALREALAVARRRGLGAVETGALNNLGNVLARLGRLPEARAAEERAIEAFRAQGDRRLEGGSRVYLAAILLGEGELALAEREARHALELATTAAARVEAMAAIAMVLLAANRGAEALAATTEAMGMLARSPTRGEEEVGVQLYHALALEAGGRREEARQVIGLASERLLARAGKIHDPELRRSFLERVPEHARTLELWQAWGR